MHYSCQIIEGIKSLVFLSSVMTTLLLGGVKGLLVKAERNDENKAIQLVDIIKENNIYQQKEEKVKNC